MLVSLRSSEINEWAQSGRRYVRFCKNLGATALQAVDVRQIVHGSQRVGMLGTQHPVLAFQALSQ